MFLKQEDHVGKRIKNLGGGRCEKGWLLGVRSQRKIEPHSTQTACLCEELPALFSFVLLSAIDCHISQVKKHVISLFILSVLDSLWREIISLFQWNRFNLFVSCCL